MLKKEGLNLRKFVTNSSTLQEKIDRNETQLQSQSIKESSIDNEEESYTKSTLGTTQQIDVGEQKVLGVRWSYSADCLVFEFSDLASQASKLDPTKRSIVGVASRFYDPVGFVFPVTICFKMLFQELCEERLNWDDPLPRNLLSKWQSLVSSLKKVQPLTIPRCYFEGISLPVLSCCLQGFCDTSKSAYAAVVYFLVETRSGCYARFVACKTRVSPVQRQTIPRLELLSALLLSKLMASVSQALDLELSLGRPSYFTDSKVALYWIKGQERVEALCSKPC